MTSKDHQGMSDEEFEALLQGRGELADMLRAVPQPEPSAELDAAILAVAQAALQPSTAATPAAANDPTIPEGGKRKRVGLAQRWKIPLAFAASAVLALHMIGFQWFPSWTEHEAKTPPAAPAAAPAQTAPETPAVVAQVEPHKERQMASEQPSPASRRSEEAAYKHKAMEPADAAPPLAAAGNVPAQAAQTNIAQAPSAAPAQAQQTYRSRAQEPAGASSAAAENEVAQAAAPKALAKRETADSNNASIAAAPADAPSQIDATKDPKAWLARIDKLLKTDSTKEALDEWTKFRRAYPDYPVAKELADRIDALKK
jgi:hypothetical protein